MPNRSILAIIVCCFGLVSCIKDEPLNTECDILSVWVDGDMYASNFYQQAQMRKDNVASNDKELVFTVRSLLALPTALPLSFTLTEGATIEPANGSPQDFTAGPVSYTVTSQDGRWQRQYTVVFREANLPAYKFGFEHVDTETSINDNAYHVFYEVDTEGNRRNIWATGNAGVALVHTGWQPEAFTVYATSDGYRGMGVCLNTQDAGDLGRMFGKPIAAGSLYMGKFDSGSVLFNPLKTTQFGVPIDRVPIRVTGYYKYEPGPKFTNAKMEVVEGRTDEAHIYAVFYRNEDADGHSVMLYGDNVLSSGFIVRKAEVESLPATDEWTRFEMFFDEGTVDAEVLSSLGYNLTVVFASSKDGAAFEGAIGSKLYVDEVEVSFENEE